MLNTATLPGPSHPHDTELAGVFGSAPTLIKLPAEDYLPLLFADLRAADWRERIQSRSLAPSQNLRLFLPIHRSFQVVLIDASCKRFGKPRLDPKKIESMGLVIRRLRDDGDEAGWMRQDDAALGWRKLVEPELDPDPKRRVSDVKFGPADLKQRLAAKRLFSGGEKHWEETVAPLFVAPPEVCAATGRTLLYGLIPVSSGEREAAITRDIDEAAFAANVSAWLGPDAPSLPNPGGSFAVKDFYDASENSALGGFFQMLTQVKFEFQVFGGSNSDLHRLLNQHHVTLANDATQALGDWLREATEIFDGDPEVALVRQLAMPLAWPALDAAFRARFSATALANAQRQLAAARDAGSLPNVARFESASARYRLRAFIRVQESEACPPRLVWSAASADFGLVPWFEPGDAAPAAIALPGLEDFSKLKPNVAFAVPKSLQGFLQVNDTKGLVDGDGKKGPSIGVGWICSFSLPIITLCAFIVLNIFLKLFDLFFNWMAFIKICVPIPVPKKDE